MRAFFDTSALLPAFLAADPRHGASRRWLERAATREIRGILGLSSIAEAYRVLSNHPAIPPGGEAQVAAAVGVLLGGPFQVVEPRLRDVRTILRDLLRRGMRGKIVFDAILVHAARRAKADVILTYDLDDFRRLAPDLAGRIRAP